VSGAAPALGRRAVLARIRALAAITTVAPLASLPAAPTLVPATLFTLLTTWGSTGCSTAPVAGPQALSGRLLLQIGAQGTTAARQWSAGFELRGSPQAGELDLTSPLGTVVAQARWQPGTAELIQGSERRRFDSLSGLAVDLLGEAVPLEALFDWHKGRPWPQQPHQPTGNGFVQAGWAVDVSALGTGGLTARRDQAPTITLRARLDPTP